MLDHDWFLTAEERGNPSTRIDARNPGTAWTCGNSVEVLIDGHAYFTRLFEVLQHAKAGDTVLFAGLEGDSDTALVSGTTNGVGKTLSDAAGRGVAVRGLVWRSHALLYNERANLLFTREVNDAGGEVFLDHRVRRGGSHHQKLFVVRDSQDPGNDVAFVGGMDVAHGRHDDPAHLGDPQAADLAERDYGPHPPWHDLQIEVRGPAVDDIALTFRERWDDAAPLDHRTPVRALLHRTAKHPQRRSAVPIERDHCPPSGPCAIQVLRTYPARTPPYPFAPLGERSIARAYIKAFRKAERLIYLEDQYLWSFRAADELCAALRRAPELLVCIVIPRFSDPDGRLLGPASAYGRERVQRALYSAGGERVAIYDLENAQSTPVYVHSKVCIVDDAWMAVGSDNLNRRSWTHDSEVSCAILDSRLDGREPRVLGSRGHRARVLARQTRLRLACEHAGLALGSADELVDPQAWFDTLRRHADSLDAWHAGGRVGARPDGHLRSHPPERTGRADRLIGRRLHAAMLDPDGRPRAFRTRDEF